MLVTCSAPAGPLNWYINQSQCGFNFKQLYGCLVSSRTNSNLLTAACTSSGLMFQFNTSLRRFGPNGRDRTCTAFRNWRSSSIGIWNTPHFCETKIIRKAQQLLRSSEHLSNASREHHGKAQNREQNFRVEAKISVSKRRRVVSLRIANPRKVASMQHAASSDHSSDGQTLLNFLVLKGKRPHSSARVLDLPNYSELSPPPDATVIARSGLVPTDAGYSDCVYKAITCTNRSHNCLVLSPGLVVVTTRVFACTSFGSMLMTPSPCSCSAEGRQPLTSTLDQTPLQRVEVTVCRGKASPWARICACWWSLRIVSSAWSSP